MSEKDDYGRGMWEYYDALFTGSADVEFYVAEAKRARGRVLELGCGTGRVTVPMVVRRVPTWPVPSRRRASLGARVGAFVIAPDTRRVLRYSRSR